MKSKNIVALIAAVLISESAGILGSIFTVPSIKGWYATLVRPALNPPSWIFGPVWTTLYLLMGVAAFLVWQKGWHRKEVRRALGLFIAQLVLNSLWSIIFFGWHQIGWAFVDLVVLWVAILIMMVWFFKISKPAMWLLLPYLLWTTFAGYLNASLWLLSRLNGNG